MTPLGGHADTSRHLPYVPVLHRTNSSSSIGTGQGIKPPLPSREVLQGSPRYSAHFESLLIQRLKTELEHREVSIEQIDLCQVPLHCIQLSENEDSIELTCIPGVPHYHIGTITPNHESNLLSGKRLYAYLAGDTSLPPAFRGLCGGPKFAGNNFLSDNKIMLYDYRLRFIASRLRCSTDPQFKQQIELCVLEAETNCGDRTAYFTETMYQTACVDQLSGSDQRQNIQVLFNLGAAYFRLDRLRAVLSDVLSNTPKLPVVLEVLSELAQKKYGVTESVEIQLGVEYYLFDSLKLPINHINPTYISYNCFKAEDMDALCEATKIEISRNNSDAFFEHMTHWEPWVKYFETVPLMRNKLSILLESLTDRLEVIMSDHSLTMQDIKTQSDQLMAEHQRAKHELIKHATREYLVKFRLNAYYAQKGDYPSEVIQRAKAHQLKAELQKATAPIQLALTNVCNARQIKILRTLSQSPLPVIELGSGLTLNSSNNLFSTVEQLMQTYYGRAILIDFHEIVDVDDFESKPLPGLEHDHWYHPFQVMLRPLPTQGNAATHPELHAKHVLSLYPKPDLTVNVGNNLREVIFSRNTLFKAAQLAWNYSANICNGNLEKLGPIVYEPTNTSDYCLLIALHLFTALKRTQHTLIEERQAFIVMFIKTLEERQSIPSNHPFLTLNQPACQELFAAFSDLNLKHPVNQNTPIENNSIRRFVKTVPFTFPESTRQVRPISMKSFELDRLATQQIHARINPTSPINKAPFLTENQFNLLVAAIQKLVTPNSPKNIYVFEVTRKVSLNVKTQKTNGVGIGYLLYHALQDRRGSLSIGDNRFTKLIVRNVSDTITTFEASYWITDGSNVPAIEKKLIVESYIGESKLVKSNQLALLLASYDSFSTDNKPESIKIVTTSKTWSSVFFHTILKVKEQLAVTPNPSNLDKLIEKEYQTQCKEVNINFSKHPLNNQQLAEIIKVLQAKPGEIWV